MQHPARLASLCETMAQAGAVVDLSQDDDGDEEEVLKVTMPPGNPPHPKPSIRWGKGRGGPLRPYLNQELVKQKKAFQHDLKSILAVSHPGFKRFPTGVPVSLCVWCFLPRPMDDFIGRVNVPGKLKPEALSLEKTMVPIKPDTDNLAKFLLDCFTGILYEDDRQVVELQMWKLRDTVGCCHGRTKFICEKFTKDWRTVMPDF